MSTERDYARKRTLRKSRLTSTTDVLQGLLQNVQTPLGDQFIRWNLSRQWKEVVGPTIAENTQPTHFEKGTLHLKVKSSSWLHHLHFVSDAIKDKVNAHMGRQWVRRIHLVV